MGEWENETSGFPLSPFPLFTVSQSPLFTVSASINGFIEHLKHLNYAAGTIINIRQDLKTFSRYLENRNITELLRISRQDILEYLREIQKARISPLSKQRKVRVIKQLFEYLKETGNFFIDPISVIKTPRIKRSLPKDILTIEEMERLIEAPNTGMLSGIRDRALLELLYSTGIRLHETAKINIEDIDLNKGNLFVRQGKGKKDRMIPVGAAAIKWLDEYITKVRPSFKNSRIQEAALFISLNGERLSKYWVSSTIKTHAHQAKIKKRITPHTFRNTMAAHLISAGADIRIVQKILGHASLKTTVIYTHVVPVDVKAMHSKTHPREV